MNAGLAYRIVPASMYEEVDKDILDRFIVNLIAGITAVRLKLADHHVIC